MSTLIIDLMMILTAVAAILLCSRAMRKIRHLKQQYKAAIILIPLYYTKIWHIILVSIFAILMAVAAALMFTSGLYFIFGSLIVILGMFAALTIKMMTCQFAVLDSGIVTPFRYINWLHLYEYRIENGKVFFFMDEAGYDTTRAISPRLSFDEANTGKLEFLLSRHKVKTK
jgi:ligand-binding SRPBCC domain-containing protein